MASEDAIIDLVDRCLVWCKNYTPDEREHAILAFCQFFENTSTTALNAAVNEWILGLNPNDPNPSLPRPGYLIRLMDKATEASSARRTDDTPPPRHAPPSPEFRAAHKAARIKIAALVGRRADPRGFPDLTDPPAVEPGAVADQIAEILHALPTPTETTSPCVCYGGFVEGEPIYYQGRDYETVAPCERCNPDLAALVKAQAALPEAEQGQFEGVTK